MIAIATHRHGTPRRSTPGQSVHSADERTVWSTVTGAASRFAFFSLPFLYFSMHGFRGFSDMDHGFLTGLSWRVLQGEQIYLDFIYVRPPLSPYIHAFVLWALPDSHGLVGERLLFYLGIWGSVALALGTLTRFFDFARTGISPTLCGSLAARVGHRFGSWLTTYVRDNWTLVEERKAFLVYTKPDPAEGVNSNGMTPTRWP